MAEMFEKYTKKYIWTQVKDYTFITLCLMLYAVSLVGFIINSDIVGGGVNGFATLIYFASGKVIPVGISALIINAFLLFLGWRILGTGFGMKTIYAVIAMSFLISFAQQWLPDQPFLADDKVLSAVIGGMLCGASIGLVFSRGGSTGGTDIVALIINKYRNISPGKVILYVDIFIISSAFIVFYFFMGKTVLESFRIVVYGFVVMFMVAYSIDFIVLGAQQSVQMLIFSKHHEEIAAMISQDIKRGVTLIKGQGWYSKEETEVILVVLRKNQLHDALKKIKMVDPNAFTSISAVTGVYGKGFDQIKE